jgi:preprotein translocase subunit SecF
VGLFGNTQENPKMEEQIRILATNLEVLNQMLVKDPNLAMATGGFTGGMSPQQFQEMVDNLKNIVRKIETNDTSMREVLNQELDYIKTTLKKIQDLNTEFPKQKQELDIVVKRMNSMIETFSAADKQSIVMLSKDLRDFNQNIGNLNENMQFFQQKLLETINYKVNEIGSNVSNKLARTAMIGMGIFVVVGVIFIFIVAVK